MTIETKSLLLIAGDEEILQVAMQSNELLGNHLNVRVPEVWTEFGTLPLQHALDKIVQSETDRNWWTYFPIHKRDKLLIGSGGYKGKPNNEGVVEIGYEIIPAYRNQGLATEMAKGLIEHAFTDDRIKSVIAHTLPFLNPSTTILKNCGFAKVGEVDDPEDGLIWKWELKRQ